MAGQWEKVGIDAAVGGVAGALDQIVQNADEKKALQLRVDGKLTADKKMPMMQRMGTYLNYGVPLLAVAGVAMGWLSGDNATRAVVVGAQLAGRKATHTFTTGAKSATPSAARTAAAYAAWERHQRTAPAGSYVPPQDVQNRLM